MNDVQAALRTCTKCGATKPEDDFWLDSRRCRRCVAAYAADWRRRNPERLRLRIMVSRAIRTGEIIRPDTCSQCGCQCEPEGHHEDYSKPLELTWLCWTCHRDRENAKKGGWPKGRPRKPNKEQ